MKILFAIKTMDNAKGGAERVLADISAGLCDAGHDVSLLTFDAAGAGSFYSVHPKIRRIYSPVGEPHNTTKLSELLRRVPRLRRDIRNANPDVVIAFMHSMFIPVAFSLIGTGIPMIASEHIVPRHYTDKRLEYLLLLCTAPLVRRITVLSHSIMRLYPKFIRHKMVALPNPVKQPQSTGALVPRPRKTILSIGRLDPQKDQKTLIAAFTTLAARYPDWDVRVFGEGKLQGALLKQIEAAGLTGRIMLAGTRADIEEEYKNATIFALPSLYESFGLVTVEAMSYGVPVIGFADCEGTNEIIVDHQNGLLAHGENRITAFAAALEELMQSSELRTTLGQAGLKTAKNYKPEIILGQWQTLIADVTTRK